MNIRLFGCGKFRWLAIEKFDRPLSEREEGFYRKHREVCFPCMRYEQQSLNAMNLISAASLESEVSEGFEDRVLAAYARGKRRVALTYWSPVFAGAAIAGLALVAALQLLSRSPIHSYNPTSADPAFRFNRSTDDSFYTSDSSTVPNLVLPNNLTR